MSIMSNKKIVTVQLRDIYLDVLENYSFHFVSDELESNGGIIYHHLLSTSSWKGFTFNPSLKRIEDYKIIGKYYRDGMSAGETELFLSNFYDAIGMTTAILKKPAVKHIGWDSHVYSDNEKEIIKKEKERKSKKKIKYITIGIILGGWVLSCYQELAGDSNLVFIGSTNSKHSL